MGTGELSAAIADILSSTNEAILTCDQIAVAVFRKLGYTPSNVSVSRIVGQRTDWQKIITAGGKTGFRKQRP